ncbi:response regulator receiver protein [Alkaliphilus metalliredigens QYMF]|uniref:Response regulator receiver protein n=1 Tax=Alkaliphilus metalliredigens (strain QYMF) TaxID=293826 RepID=A6TS40_ALKMQ|nr:DUF512 domain-containing protein [Alkaliphilus metalliredigens]ABR49008.1 response regulator receiver protein [Alkaliphilus metalliredigens QYMF]
MKEVKIKNVISKVYEGSIAEEVGIEVDDILININGNLIEDIIEYKFYLSDEYLEIEIEKPNGESWVYEVEKDYDEDLGMEFENPIIDQAKSCKNNCLFCFVDQLPPNMRESLYFKDDDSRLSFLHGNYITLTNMKDKDIEKIIKYRISPINISVHTTNGELRKQMLNNRFAGNILDILKKLHDHHIEMNCQIVLCPNVNDGKELDDTLRHLGNLSESIKSVAVVPVGLTAYRQHLQEVQPFNRSTASKTVEQIEGWQRQFQKYMGRNFVYTSDEFYILAEKALPDYDSYEGFPQLENGVGMVVKLKKEFHNYISKLSVKLNQPKSITILTGQSSCEIIKELGHQLTETVHGLQVNVVCIKNRFFGGHVSVTGLITGSDILSTLKGQPLGDGVMIPESMLKSGELVFLDDVTVSEIEEALEVPIQVCEVNGKQFVKGLLTFPIKDKGKR